VYNHNALVYIYIRHLKIYCNLLFLLIVPIFVIAQSEEGNVDTVRVSKILITSTRISTPLLRSPISISTSRNPEITSVSQGLSLQESISHVSGLFALNANNFAQDLRISIRGFGARSAFGIRGIKLIVDGIPETTPDGQGQIDNLVLDMIDNIEIVKGPAAALYGNASGGTIKINSINSVDRNSIELHTGAGSYGYLNTGITVKAKSSRSHYIIGLSHQKTDGYREQSGFRSSGMSYLSQHELGESTEIKLNLGYTNSPEANDPGGLTIEEANADRSQARQRNVTYRTAEKISQYKSAITATHQINAQSSLQWKSYFSNRQFQGLLPFVNGGWVNLSRNYYGSSFDYKKKTIFSRAVNEVVIGLSTNHQYDGRERYQNVEGIQGNSTLDQSEKFNNTATYISTQLQISNWLFLTSIRYDYNKLSAVDRLLSDGDDSGLVNYNDLNYAIGFNYSVSNKVSLYSNIRSSFETPTLSELSENPISGSGFNTDLKPQKAYNYEFGIRSSQISIFDFDLTLFRIETRNELIPFETQAFPDRQFYRNAASTIRSGIECNVKAQLSNAWSMDVSYTDSDFKFGDWDWMGNNLKGNALPGIPVHSISAIARYIDDNGLRIQLQHRYIGQIQLDNRNTTQDEAYSITDFKLGYELKKSKYSIVPYLGINNMFSTFYNDNIKINAFGKRYYEPAPERNIYFGIRLKIF